MDSSLLLPLSMHTDVETTNNLIKSSDVFNELDIWRLKFKQDFPNRKYLDFFSSETNYRLQDKEGPRCPLWAIMIVRDHFVDNIIHENDDMNDVVFDRIGEYFHKGVAACGTACLVEIEVKERYVIIYNTEEYDWTDLPVLYASTFEEAGSISRELNSKKSDRGWCHGFIIDIGEMIPVFYYNKETCKPSEKFYTRF
jgi:hypothetical protein